MNHKLTRILQSNLDLSFILLLLTLKVYLMLNLLDLVLTRQVILLNFGIFIILTSIAHLFSPFGRRIYLFLLYLVCSLLLLADLLNYRYFYVPLTTYSFLQLANLNGLGSSIFSVFKWTDLFLLADLVIWPVLFALTHSAKRCKSFFAVQLVLGILLTTVYPFHQIYLEHDNIFRRFEAANSFRVLGPLGFHVVDTAYYLKDRNIKLTPEREEQILNWFAAKDISSNQESLNAFQGISQGKNLIIIQVESLQNFVIGNSIGGQEITPNINKLLEHSLYFQHFYPQTVDGNSSDAELAVNTSLYPISEGSTFFSYPNNHYNSLPLLLKSEGYSTLAIHGDEASYWNRSAAYPHLGFEQFWDITKFSNTEEIGMGLSDMAMFKQTAALLQGTPQPFYSFIITLTSHYPFYLPPDLQLLKLPPSLADTNLGNYLQIVHYTDQAIGNFIRDLKNNDLLDHSLVVIYGDHDGLFKRDKEQLENLWTHHTISSDEWVRKYLPVPLIIYQSDFKGYKPEVYGGQVDVLPTISSILGFSQKSTQYSMGRNLLTTKNGFAIIPKGDYINDAAYVTKDEIKDSLGDEEKHTLQVADLIIRTNFLEKALKKLPK